MHHITHRVTQISTQYIRLAAGCTPESTPEHTQHVQTVAQYIKVAQQNSFVAVAAGVVIHQHTRVLMTDLHGQADGMSPEDVRALQESRAGEGREQETRGREEQNRAEEGRRDETRGVGAPVVGCDVITSYLNRRLNRFDLNRRNFNWVPVRGLPQLAE